MQLERHIPFRLKDSVINHCRLVSGVHVQTRKIQLIFYTSIFPNVYWPKYCLQIPNKETDVKNESSSEHVEVLIVDDEIDICFLLSGIVKQKKLSTAYVSTLHDAELAIDIHKPDILFIDNNLPDGNGINFIKFVKNTHPETKIVMITAYDTLMDEQMAINEGADFFIGKPFTRDIINKTLDSLIKAAN